MQVLKQSTEVKVVIGPFVDKTDGLTPETGITLAAADEAEVIKHNTDSVTDISGGTMAAIVNCDGWYVLTMTTAYTDTLGMLTVVIQDDSECLPIHARFMVSPANVWDSMYGSDKLDVNVAEMTAGIITAAAIATDAIDADALKTDAVTEIVLAILKTDWTGITGEADRCLLNAMRFLRNKWSITGTTLTVTKEDDSTTAWTSALTADASAVPVIGSDPAGP